MNYLCIVIGGGIGALFRYLSSQFINTVISAQFKFGTVFVNCVGALLIGFFISFSKALSLNVKWNLFIVVGFLGGYTTFSAYSLETAQYFIDGKIKQAVINIFLNNILCVIFVFLGMWLNRVIQTKISS